MQKNKLNNVIVLKELSSNIIEEAIIVLKKNVNFKLEEKEKTKPQEMSNKTILKEAEFVIENYINKIENKKAQIENDKLKKRYKYLKFLMMIIGTFNFFLLFKIF